MSAASTYNKVAVQCSASIFGGNHPPPLPSPKTLYASLNAISP